ncbi:MAG: SMP-30/gluconolactonase/LRE family protein [Acidobacteria bacterium]|nr:SMP-30/gluconolactonase/LRE family protein [Acidobacteriota bacterium]
MPHLSPADLEPVGQDLHRPECVIATPDGDCYVPDWRGGVTAIRADGSQQTWLARPEGPALRPNGIALMPTGDFLVANLADEGGVWCLGRDGSLRPLVTGVDGRVLPPANFVTLDAHGRMWISVSTRQVPRQRAWNAAERDGFIVLLDGRGARIVADGLQYTNEVRPDPSGRWLYVVETFGRRLTRFPLHADGSLGTREVVITFGHGCFPDGFAFDEAGGIWVTSLVSNRLLRLRPDGALENVLEDVNTAFVDEVEQAFVTGTMTARHLGPIPDTRLQQLTSLAFGGPDRRTVYLGSLHGRCIYRFRADVGGVAPGHAAVSVSR